MKWFMSLDWKFVAASFMVGVLMVVVTKSIEAILPDKKEERFRAALLAALNQRNGSVTTSVERSADSQPSPTQKEYCSLLTAMGRHYFILGASLRSYGKSVGSDWMAFAAYFYAIDQFERCVRFGGDSSFMDAALANIYGEEDVLKGFAQWVHPYPNDAVVILQNVIGNSRVKQYMRDAAKKLLDDLYVANPRLKPNN